MKKITTAFLFLLIITSFSSCLSDGKKNNSEEKSSENSEYRTESALGLYEMQIPNFMKATSGLNADASMQFQNIYKETYLAVIEEPKQEFIETFKEMGEYNDSASPAANYQSIQMGYFSEGMEVTRMGTPQKMRINGLDAEQVEFVGKVPSIEFEIFYLMTFVEGKDNLYWIMDWTLSENEEEYKEIFKAMTSSFKEI